MKKMEDFFDIKSTEEIVDEAPVKTKEELMVEAKSIYTSLSTAEKIDIALPTVDGLDQHDLEMDDIAKRAVRTFEDLLSLGGNVQDLHAGKIYEVAGQMLKTALEAKNAKADKKLRMIELQLKKARIEQIDFEQGNGDRRSVGNEFDRNELIKLIIDAKDKKDETQ